MKPFDNLKKILRRRWDSVWTKKVNGIAKVGGESAWAIKTDVLPDDAIVISGGVGKDVSFEKKMVELYNCKVFIFDPSPTGLETMSRIENQHERIVFIPKGLAETAGTVVFDPPKNPDEGSYSISRGEAGFKTISFDCTTVSNFL